MADHDRGNPVNNGGRRTDTMNLHDTSTIQLLLDLTKPIEELEGRLKANGEKKEGARQP